MSDPSPISEDRREVRLLRARRDATARTFVQTMKTDREFARRVQQQMGPEAARRPGLPATAQTPRPTSEVELARAALSGVLRDDAALSSLARALGAEKAIAARAQSLEGDGRAPIGDLRTRAAGAEDLRLQTAALAGIARTSGRDIGTQVDRKLLAINEKTHDEIRKSAEELRSTEALGAQVRNAYALVNLSEAPLSALADGVSTVEAAEMAKLSRAVPNYLVERVMGSAGLQGSPAREQLVRKAIAAEALAQQARVVSREQHDVRGVDSRNNPARQADGANEMSKEATAAVVVAAIGSSTLGLVTAARSASKGADIGVDFGLSLVPAVTTTATPSGK